MKIQQILDKIDDHALFVPAFQREYVWKRENAKNLVDSLIKEYPTGTLLTWETNDPPELKGDWQYDPKQGAVKLILDGQQRITTLYLLIRGQIPPYYTEAEIQNDPRGLYVNLSTLELSYYKKTTMAGNPYWVNITDIFLQNVRGNRAIQAIRNEEGEIAQEEEDKLWDNFNAVSNIPNYDFLEQSVPVRASLREAINIFYIVNDSGVNLTDAELALAQISGYWPQAREAFKRKLEQLKSKGFDFKLDFIIYCLLGVVHHMGSDMRRLHDASNEETLRHAWERLDTDVLDYVVNLLRSQAYVEHTKEINSVYALVPIVVYVFERGSNNLSQEEINKIVKWFYYSQIRQRYISQLPQKLDKDISIVINSEKPFDELLNIIAMERPLHITPEEFIGVDIRNALYSLMRWYFKSRGAICLTTGVQIRHDNAGEKYSLEWDHIFPYSVLKNHGYNPNNRHKYALAQEITNRAVLTQVANRRKGNKLAEEYLKNVKEQFPDALKLQSIPENEELWKIERFEDFLQKRREILAEELNDFLAGITEMDKTAGEVTVDELIQEGESSELELKSSLCWSYREGTKNSKLEEVIMKSIAAFSNSEGGTLLIGVDDDGEVLGLAPDFHVLNGGKDEFEQHLRNLVSKYFDKSFAASHLSVSFPDMHGKLICRIDIERSSKPVYITTKDKNDQKHEKFYVRSGNTSQELSPSETHEYIQYRF